MKLGNAVIYVENVPETMQFYEKAFGLKPLYTHPSNEYGEMATGDTILAFISERMLDGMKLLGDLTYRRNRPAEVPLGSHIAFFTENVEADYKRAVAAGAVGAVAPAAKPWGTIAFVRDNNGFLVELLTTPERLKS